jgi:2-hydroxychromene-2-carboxylate isomerase
MRVRAGREPWSFAADRSDHLAEIERRALKRGLPPLRYLPGRPRETCSLAPSRACLLAEDAGLLRKLSRELFAALFVRGESFAELRTTIAAAARIGLDGEHVRTGIARPDVKERLRAATDEAIARSVIGIPTIAVGERIFRGDDQLEHAAAAARAGGRPERQLRGSRAGEWRRPSGLACARSSPARSRRARSAASIITSTIRVPMRA